MSIETAVLVGHSGSPLFWHLPPGRTAGSLPDSQRFWEAIWSFRNVVGIIAHTHPGDCQAPAPSHEDVTTFAAIEQALGKRLTWGVGSRAVMRLFRWDGPERYNYRAIRSCGYTALPLWGPALHRFSYARPNADLIGGLQLYPFRGALAQATEIASCFHELDDERRDLLVAKIEAAILAEAASEADGIALQPELLAQLAKNKED